MDPFCYLESGRLKGYLFGMPIYPKIKLSILRDIGWVKWDPIGLAPDGGGWPEYCADEYDGYLTRAASMFVEGRSRKDVEEYFVRMTSESMGLSQVNAEAAKLTANAIADYIQSVPDGPANIN